MSLFGWCQAPAGARPDHRSCIGSFTRAADGVTTIVCACPCHDRGAAK